MGDDGEHYGLCPECKRWFELPPSEEMIGPHHDCSYFEAPQTRATFSPGFVMASSRQAERPKPQAPRLGEKPSPRAAPRRNAPSSRRHRDRIFLDRIMTPASGRVAREFYLDKPRKWLADEAATFRRVPPELARSGSAAVWRKALQDVLTHRAEQVRVAQDERIEEMIGTSRPSANRPAPPRSVSRVVSGGLPTLGHRS